MADEGTDGQPVTTVLARMTAAGIGEPRALDHIERGMVRVAGEPVTDPQAPLPWPTRWVVAAV